MKAGAHNIMTASEVPLFQSVPALTEHCLAIHPGIVSLDLFDTLLLRDALSPECIFHRMLDHDISRRYGLNSLWPLARLKAGRRMARSSRHGETTLSEIYDFLSRTGVLSAAVATQLMEIELLEERKSWRPNKPLLDFARSLMEKNIPIVIYSDTYLPLDELQAWTGRFLSDVTVYSSSATMCTKTSGRAFAYLKRRYPGYKILHIGDNLHSDGIMPRMAGVESAIIDGQGRFSSTLPVEVSSLARLRGLTCLPAVTDDDLSDRTSLVVAQWAYGWALFLISFLEAIAHFVKVQHIEEVWFTSRDCASIFHCLKESGRITDFPNASYIYTSRSSLAPLVTLQPDRKDREEYRLCERYIRARLSSKNIGSGQPTRLLVVDIGGRGTLQKAIQTALGSDAFVQGYYVGLDPKKTWLSNSDTACFLEWNRATFSEPLTELMCGFVGHRCSGYRMDALGDVIPTFTKTHGDASDPVYVRLLRRYLTTLLMENWQPAHGVTNTALSEACLLMRQRFHIFPTRSEALAIAHWSYRNGDGTARSIGGESLNLGTILLMSGRNENYWPNGALARRLSNPHIVRFLQKASVRLREIRRQFSALQSAERRDESIGIKHGYHANATGVDS